MREWKIRLARTVVSAVGSLEKGLPVRFLSAERANYRFFFFAKITFQLSL
jgi:hypothetical protein